MSEGQESYYAVAAAATVSYSEQIDDHVVADYDAAGAVVGLEFLDPAAALKVDHYLAEATRRSRGALRVAKPGDLRRVA